MNQPKQPILEQELEAPGEVLALLHETALALGASATQAGEVARTGVFELESRSIASVFSGDERALVLSTALPGQWLADPANRERALKASTSLMLQAGVAFCRPFGELATGAALICRWTLATGGAPALAAWIREFAAMANLTHHLIDQEAV